MACFLNEEVKRLKRPASAAALLETLLTVGSYLQGSFFSLWSFGLPQIRRDIQNLTHSPVCTQLWPLWVNLIICVCRPVRVLSLRSTVSPQAPPRFHTIDASWPLSLPTVREMSGNMPQTNFQPSGRCRPGTLCEWRVKKQTDTVCSPHPDFHQKFLPKKKVSCIKPDWWIWILIWFLNRFKT